MTVKTFKTTIAMSRRAAVRQGGMALGVGIKAPFHVVKQGHGALVVRLVAACLVASGIGAGVVIGADYALMSGAVKIAPAPRLAFRPVGYGAVAARANDVFGQSAKERQSLFLVRSTLLALDQANRTGNYSVLRALGTPLFRSRNSSADLAVIFSSLRRNKIDLSEAAIVSPRWQHPMRVKGDGLQLRGVIAMNSRDVFFDMTFKPVAGKWNIFALAVSAKPLVSGASRQVRGGGNGGASPAARGVIMVPEGRAPSRG